MRSPPFSAATDGPAYHPVAVARDGLKEISRSFISTPKTSNLFLREAHIGVWNQSSFSGGALPAAQANVG